MSLTKAFIATPTIALLAIVMLVSALACQEQEAATTSPPLTATPSPTASTHFQRRPQCPLQFQHRTSTLRPSPTPTLTPVPTPTPTSAPTPTPTPNAYPGRLRLRPLPRRRREPYQHANPNARAHVHANTHAGACSRGASRLTCLAHGDGRRLVAGRHGRCGPLAVPGRRTRGLALA